MTMHEIAVLDRSGETKTIWDSSNADEVAAARKQFEDLKKKGFSIFRVNKQSEKGSRMHEFDSDAEKMIAVAPIAGG